MFTKCSVFSGAVIALALATASTVEAELAGAIRSVTKENSVDQASFDTGFNAGTYRDEIRSKERLRFKSLLSNFHRAASLIRDQRESSLNEDSPASPNRKLAPEGFNTEFGERRLAPEGFNTEFDERKLAKSNKHAKNNGNLNKCMKDLDDANEELDLIWNDALQLRSDLGECAEAYDEATQPKLLFVQMAESCTLRREVEDGDFTYYVDTTDMDPETYLFTDRPYTDADEMSTLTFVETFDERFESSPPNAAMTFNVADDDNPNDPEFEGPLISMFLEAVEVTRSSNEGNLLAISYKLLQSEQQAGIIALDQFFQGGPTTFEHCSYFIDTNPEGEAGGQGCGTCKQLVGLLEAFAGEVACSLGCLGSLALIIGPGAIFLGTACPFLCSYINGEVGPDQREEACKAAGFCALPPGTNKCCMCQDTWRTTSKTKSCKVQTTPTHQGGKSCSKACLDRNRYTIEGWGVTEPYRYNGNCGDWIKGTPMCINDVTFN